MILKHTIWNIFDDNKIFNLEDSRWYKITKALRNPAKRKQKPDTCHVQGFGSLSFPLSLSLSLCNAVPLLLTCENKGSRQCLWGPKSITSFCFCFYYYWWSKIPWPFVSTWSYKWGVLCGGSSYPQTCFTILTNYYESVAPNKGSGHTYQVLCVEVLLARSTGDIQMACAPSRSNRRK